MTNAAVFPSNECYLSAPDMEIGGVKYMKESVTVFESAKDYNPPSTYICPVCKNVRICRTSLFADLVE